MDRLKIRGCLFLEQSFNRPNLHYEVRKKVKGVVADIANYIKTNHANETGIIYCFSRNKCEAVALELRNKHNIRARHYHAQLSPADKHRTQQAWQTGECEIIVATVRTASINIDEHEELIAFVEPRLPLVWALIRQTVRR